MEEAAGRPARVQRRGSGKERVRDKKTQIRFGNRKSEGKSGRQKLSFDILVGLTPLIRRAFVCSEYHRHVCCFCFVDSIVKVISTCTLHLPLLYFPVALAVRRLAPFQQKEYIVGCNKRGFMAATCLG